MKYSNAGKFYFPLMVMIVLGSCVHADEDSKIMRFSECPSSPNCVSSLADSLDEIHYIDPFIFNSDLSAVFEGLISYLKKQTNVEIIELERDNYIHAVYKSKFFRFKDDVEFAFRNSGDAGILVDIQSRSRIGYSDMGVNRTRMEEIRQILKTEFE
jgi:uncharacterized protein (DUF1499 family)